MSNVHTPERQAGESFDAYKARRAASRAAVKTMTKGPTQAPWVPIPGTSPNWVLWWTGQRVNPGKPMSSKDARRVAVASARKVETPNISAQRGYYTPEGWRRVED